MVPRCLVLGALQSELPLVQPWAGRPALGDLSCPVLLWPICPAKVIFVLLWNILLDFYFLFWGFSIKSPFWDNLTKGLDCLCIIGYFCPKKLAIEQLHLVKTISIEGRHLVIIMLHFLICQIMGFTCYLRYFKGL